MKKPSPSKFDGMLADIALRTAAREDGSPLDRSLRSWVVGLFLFVTILSIVGVCWWRWH